MSFISFPQLIGKFLVEKNFNEGLTKFTQQILDWLSNPYIYNSVVFVLVVAFSFFYLSVVFKTEELAENLQKQGAFIQGIRPGENTAEYLRKVSLRLTVLGALFLGVLSILPDIVTKFIDPSSRPVFSGTGLLIVIGVVLEIKRQVGSMMTVRSYNKYL